MNQGLKEAGVEVDRRLLSELATNDPETYKALLEVARKTLAAL
jgi:large subunit ribosomal protein L20